MEEVGRRSAIIGGEDCLIMMITDTPGLVTDTPGTYPSLPPSLHQHR